MIEAALVARCPAKVNLALRVLGRREDGYHDVRTVFQAIDLWDELEGQLAARLEMTCDDPRLPAGESNLVLRAAMRLRDACGEKRGAMLQLRKRIPVGGGLGGGSSDAAGALLLLCRLWNLSLDLDRLSALAAEVGSDVPFFLQGGTALGEGRGDRIRALPFAGAMSLLLGFPPFGVSTADAYSMFAAERALKPRSAKLTPPLNHVSVQRFSRGKFAVGNDLEFGINDLEGVVFGRWPELGTFRDDLVRQGATLALLSGSGSTVFGVFEDRACLGRAVGPLRARFRGWSLLESRAIGGAVHVERS